MKLEKILIATKNAGKINEIKSKLSDLNISFITFNEIEHVDEPVENGNTFYDNALLKAKYYFSKTGIPSLADDSGLAVEALNGAPGVYSARFAGKNATDKDNNKKLLISMIGEKNRKAKFVCNMVLYASEDQIYSAEGNVEGEINYQPMGDHGFGYDPLFYIKSLNKTMAELSTKQKNEISHRAQALDNLYKVIKEKG